MFITYNKLLYFLGKKYFNEVERLLLKYTASD